MSDVKTEGVVVARGDKSKDINNLFFFKHEFVFVFANNKHEDIKCELLPLVEQKLDTTKDKQRGTWLSDVNTEFFNMEKDDPKYVTLIQKAIFPAFDAMFAERLQNNAIKTITIAEVWYNRYYPGAWQEVHTHATGKFVFSGVYLLDVAEENPLLFFSQGAANTRFTDGTYRPDVQEGDIVLFPSELPHYVMPCTERRTTVAFNVTCEFY